MIEIPGDGSEFVREVHERENIPIEGRRFCSIPDSLVMNAVGDRWNKGHIRYCFINVVPRISEATQISLTKACFDHISSIINRTFEYTEIASQADIRMDAGTIDGSGRTLAWSELANGSDRPLKQMYDSAEAWAAAVAQADWNGSGIPLYLTRMHEVIHALGVGHSPGDDIMAPFLNTKVWTITGWAQRELLARYGAAPPRPTTPPIDPPPGVNPYTIRFKANPETKHAQIILPEGWVIDPS